MRKSLAACCAAILFVLVVAPFAHAAGEYNVRIEGKSETLYEGKLPVSIQQVEATSDTEPHECDGISEAGEEPAVTPTLASAEAMESIGQTFDGQWYSYIGPYGDYFITRWGPDEQDNAAGAWWGVLVNNELTNVGGCQYRLDEEDEALWLYNAFASPGRPLLALFPEAAHYTEGPRPTQVTVTAGEPLPLEVVAYPAGGEGVAAESPSRAGSSAYEGAEIAPVTVGEHGFQRVDTTSPEAVITNAEGKASITYSTPGTYRLKATVGEPGDESVVRSNGLEVVVVAKPAASEDVQQPATQAVATPPTTAPAATRIAKPRLDRSALSHGRLKLSWSVVDSGAGVRSWTLGVKMLGHKGGFVTRAKGDRATGASIRLAAGHRYRLRLTLTDGAGHTSRYGLGTVAVPRAARG
jgi:hypothetical protein